MTPPSPLETHLAAQLRVPGGWEVVVGATVTAGWLGSIRAPLVVLAPGPGGAEAHRTQLVVFVVPEPAQRAAPRFAPHPGSDLSLTAASSSATDSPQSHAPSAASRHRRGEQGTDHALAWAAAAGIPEAWRIDEARGWTEVFRAPWDGRFRSRTLCLPGEEIVPLALTRLRIVPLTRPCAR